MNSRRKIPHCRGFTLLELLTVIVIIAILAVLLAGSAGSFRARAERASCVANLQNLYAGAASYIADQGHWPQIDPGLVETQPKQYAGQWIAALAPYGLSRKNWVCPSQQRALGSPDINLADNTRTDYDAMPFDSGLRTPYTWPTQPWFVEHAAEHDGGPLIIFTSGEVLSLTDAMHYQSTQ